MAPTKDKKKTAGSLDTNGDGKISSAEANVGNDILSGLDIPDLPGQTVSKGAPLLPYQISDPDSLNGVDFANNSITSKAMGGKDRIGVRYYEADTLTPLKWSPELRAQLQRSMYAIGLYGKEKVTLGSWSAHDQGAFSQLLAQANVDGRQWFEQLAYWRANPPQDILEKLATDEPKKPTIQVTNPLDIRAAAAQADQATTGGGNLSFIEGAPAAYQPVEAAAQQAVYADQDAGGGGTVTQAPDIGQFFADKARREHPIEVGGYSFLKAFNTFAQMMGGVE